MKKKAASGIGNIPTILAGAFILMSAAVYNGYPLVYSDTGTYIYSGFDKFVPEDRPLVYGLFVFAASLKQSLWLVVFAQSLILSYVLFTFFGQFFSPGKKPGTAFISIVGFLSLFTGVSWCSSQIMPDIFSAVVIMLVPLLLFDFGFSWPRKVFLGILLVFSITVHLSHFVLSLSSLLAMIVLALLLEKKLAISVLKLKNTLVALAVVMSSWLTLPAVHYIYGGGFVLSKSPHVFLMAHLADTGILKRFLDEKCREKGDDYHSFCEYREEIPLDLGSFLWDEDSVLFKTGGWENSREEYNRIIHDMLSEPFYLIENIRISIGYGLTQLLRNSVGDGLGEYKKGSPPWQQVHWRFLHEENAYFKSLQNIWGGAMLKFDKVNTIQTLLLSSSLFAFLGLIHIEAYRVLRPELVFTTLFTLLGIVMNAMVTAGLNAPCDRFQARVAWLFPMILVIVLVSHWKELKSQAKSFRER